MSELHATVFQAMALTACSTSELTDELTYRNYAYNRVRSPEIQADRWALIYGAEKAEKMEARFQSEQSLADQPQSEPAGWPYK